MFHLPKDPIYTTSTTIVAPNTDANVSIDKTDINNPIFAFTIPRQEFFKFHFGSTYELDDSDQEQELSLITYPELEDWFANDYYLDTDTGFIYEVTTAPSSSSDTIGLTKVGNFSYMPLSEVNGIDPYVLDGTTYVPSVPTITGDYVE